jgi:tetratricopeptide (TPR) repeat protein
VVLGRGPRTAGLVLAGALAVLSFVTLTSNRSLGEAGAALNRSDAADAARAAERAETWAPWSTDALERRAAAALLAGSKEEARRLYREAIAKDPGDWELWLALAYASEGAARRRAYERAAALNPLGGQVRQLGQQLGVRNPAAER